LRVEVRHRISWAYCWRRSRWTAQYRQQIQLSHCVRKGIAAAWNLQRVVEPERRHPIHLVVVEVRIVGRVELGITAADRSLASAERIKSESESWAEIVQRFVLEIGSANVARCCWRIGVDVVKIGDQAVDFRWNRIWLPANTQVDGQPAVHAPVILNVGRKHPV